MYVLVVYSTLRVQRNAASPDEGDFHDICEGRSREREGSRGRLKFVNHRREDQLRDGARICWRLLGMAVKMIVESYFGPSLVGARLNEDSAGR